MARFNIPLNAVSVSAAVDLWEIVPSATRGIYIEQIALDQKTLTSGRLGVTIISGYSTSGSGGSTVTPVAIGPEAAATFGGTTPVEVANTTQASSGSPVTLWSACWNLVAGFLWLPVPEHRIWIPPSTRVVVRLVDAPASAMSVGGNIVIVE